MYIQTIHLEKHTESNLFLFLLFDWSDSHWKLCQEPTSVMRLKECKENVWTMTSGVFTFQQPSWMGKDKMYSVYPQTKCFVLSRTFLSRTLAIILKHLHAPFRLGKIFSEDFQKNSEASSKFSTYFLVCLFCLVVALRSVQQRLNMINWTQTDLQL